MGRMQRGCDTLFPACNSRLTGHSRKTTLRATCCEGNAVRKLDLVYALGTYVPFGVYCVTLVIGVFPSPGERGVLMEEPGTMMTLGTCMFLMGLNMLLFCKRAVRQRE